MTIEHGRAERLTSLVETATEGGCIARALGASIFTGTSGLQDLHTMIQDAVRCHFDESKAPEVIRLHFVREEGIDA
jgi:hypothetical protein